MLITIVLLTVAIMVLGAAIGKPLGWVALGLALIALLLNVLGKL
jgi:hypothetical protein